jgi:hypothetical protein
VEAFEPYWSSFPRNLQNHTCGIVSLALRVTTDSFSRDSRYINYGTDVFYALSSCAVRDLAPGLDGRRDQPPHTFYPNTATTLQQVPEAEAQISISLAPITASLP